MNEDFTVTSKDKVLRALQLVELEGLMEIDRICRKFGIEYSLGGGTCLGRVRHGGFIPWDDDIDVDMTVENYDRFMEIAPEEIDTDRFFLRCKATDSNHYRTAAKLEIKGTVLEFGGWKNAKIEAGVFVDIFRVNYLPDNDKLRKKISHRLYMIHAVENHRMLGANTKALRENFSFFWWFVSEFVPIKWIMKWEERIIDKYGRNKTGWMIGDSLASGDYTGYSSEGTDEYEDVTFEGKIVRDKKQAKTFLTKLYGSNYYKWLPPVDRISNHKWLRFDLGECAEKYGLPANYSDYLTINYNEDKLKQMQKISITMANEIKEICECKGLKYFILSEEESRIWKGPLLVGMPRKDYEEFLKSAEDDLDKKYILQHRSNTDNFYYAHAKLRQKYTELRDSRIPEEVDRSFHSGFYIDIVPMDNAPNNRAERRKFADTANRLENQLVIKWTRNNLFRFRKSRIKTKIKLLLMFFKTVEGLYEHLNTTIKKYNNEETGYYIYSKCESRGFITVPKLNPTSVQLRECETLDETINRLSKRYVGCFLNYCDDEDYQLSVLRYDEVNDRMLSNDEIYESN